MLLAQRLCAKEVEGPSAVVGERLRRVGLGAGGKHFHGALRARAHVASEESFEIDVEWLLRE